MQHLDIIQIVETYNHIYSILKNCPYRILKKWTVQIYQDGEVVLHQGERLEYFHIIVSGEANIYMMSESGKKYTQAIYHNGDFIGEIEVFDDLPSVCNVEALGELVLIKLRVKDFLELIQIDNHMSYYFNRNLARYLYNLSEKAGLDSLYSLKHRLILFLLDSMYLFNVSDFIVNKTGPQIGDQLGVTTRSINRLLREWREKGIIQVENDAIIIRDKNRLEEQKDK